MIPALSYRVKIPLALCFISLLTAAVLLSVFAVSAYRSLHQHLLDLAEDVGSALAPSLAGPLQHDDLWQAYVILSDTQSAFTPLLVVLDAQRRIFASNQPRELPVLNRLDQTDTRYQALAGWFDTPGRTVESYTNHELNRVFTITPVTQSDIQVGQLIVGYPLQWLHERFLALAWQAACTTLAVTAVIMLLGVLWARHMTAPLMTITDAMDRLEDDDPVVGRLPDSDDEVGRLSRRFRLLVKDLKLKRQLEKQVLASERMAAIGRMTAGIAHEINNPLGGMLNALDTFRYHGRQYDLAEKTFALLERGLLQIRTILAALLIDVKREEHALTAADIDDVRTLLGSDQRHQRITVQWQHNLSTPLPLPAGRIRQVLLNLLLNALHAAQPDGRVSCMLTADSKELAIRIENSGKAISAELMTHLFEPFASRDGTGLGLWVTYQIVSQLRGDIRARNIATGACFEVSLPFTQELPA